MSVEAVSVGAEGSDRQLFSIERLLDKYIEYLCAYRDLADSSIRHHRFYARCFLEHCGRGGSICLAEILNVQDIQAFAVKYARGHGQGASRVMFSTLRVLLYYLYIEGYVDNDLAEAVPSLQRRQLSSVPRGISDTHIKQLSESIDRSEDIGKRDYAIIQILSTYGVRGVHVRKLRLEDVQWKENLIVFRPAKGGKLIRQHLTPVVGNSLVDYLRHGRPSDSPYREVFLTCTGKPKPLRFSYNISCMIRKRLRKAGINLPDGVSRGSHSFRHAFATRMVCGSQPFKYVADMLGHKSINSTMIYTKIDLPRMRQAALEWPEVSL